MYKYSVRIELRSSEGDTTCSCTISCSFENVPQKGDLIVLNQSDQFVAKIASILHFVTGTPQCMLVTEPIKINKYDLFISRLDWLKSNFIVSDISADAEPKPYYVLYRSLLSMLDRTKEIDPILSNDPQEVKITAETCRGLLAAEILKDEYKDTEQLIIFNKHIEDFHTLVIREKSLNQGRASILSIVKQWDNLVNSNKNLKWSADNELAIKIARDAIGRLKSIKIDKLPVWVQVS